jgi:hypothetical protein
MAFAAGAGRHYLRGQMVTHCRPLPGRRDAVRDASDRADRILRTASARRRRPRPSSATSAARPATSVDSRSNRSPRATPRSAELRSPRSSLPGMTPSAELSKWSIRVATSPATATTDRAAASGRCGDWLAPPPSPPRPQAPGRHHEAGMGTSTWPPARTSTWPPVGTFSRPRTTREAPCVAFLSGGEEQLVGSDPRLGC